jgi:membrane-bound lytic murein transglycosylase D
MRGMLLQVAGIGLLSLPLFGCSSAIDSSTDASNLISVTGRPANGPGTATPASSTDARPMAADLVPSTPEQLPFVRNSPETVPPFPLVLNRAVQSYVDGYLSRPASLKRSFKRIRPYAAEMASLLRDRGLPSDLVYLTFAESEFSSNGAGPWQLSRETARRFGLTVNQWVDERRDPIKSTRAAADYLTELHEQTGGDWCMTLVAWNNGDAGVDRYLHLREASYDRLMTRIPRRTRALLNRFMAVAMIARHREEYGMERAEFTSQPYRVMAVKGGTTLESVAEHQHAGLEILRSLNPALFRECVPPTATSYPVRVPVGTVEAVLLPTDS